MSERKTERLYVSAPLDGTTDISAAESFSMAISNLVVAGQESGREVLFDTLEVTIDRETVDDGTTWDRINRQSTISTFATITASAEAVKR
jgi:hypothetical protein